MGRLNFGNDLLDAKVFAKLIFSIQIIKYFNRNFKLKGILSNVTLNNKVLTNWKACLTNNFIPNYQADSNSTSLDIDFIRKIMHPKNLLANKNLK
jgi:hypothetical protein